MTSNAYRQHPAPTGQFVDGSLRPVPAATSADALVWFPLAEENGERVWEGLAAASEGDGWFVVRAVPLFAYDLNFGDRVTAVASADGALVATGIVEDGGNFTFRVALHEGGVALREVVEQFGSLGCLIEGWSESLLGLGCPPSLAQPVAELLHEAEARGDLRYETGRQWSR